MIPLLFLLALVAAIYLMYRAGKRGRKVNDAIEANRDLKAELKVREIEEENDRLTSILTKGENNDETN